MSKALILTSILLLSTTIGLQAQRVIWQDDFETSKGWSEYEDEAGKAIVKDGHLIIKSKQGWTFFSKCKTNLDGNKNVTINADIKVKRNLIIGQRIGIAFDYNDTKNYMAFYVENGFVYFIQCYNGVIIREDKEPLKRNVTAQKKRDKDAPDMVFEIQKKGQSILLLVNDEETIEMDDIVVKSNRIAFFVTNDQEAYFDNVKISQ